MCNNRSNGRGSPALERNGGRNHPFLSNAGQPQLLNRFTSFHVKMIRWGLMPSVKRTLAYIQLLKKNKDFWPTRVDFLNDSKQLFEHVFWLFEDFNKIGLAAFALALGPYNSNNSGHFLKLLFPWIAQHWFCYDHCTVLLSLGEKLNHAEFTLEFIWHFFRLFVRW